MVKIAAALVIVLALVGVPVGAVQASAAAPITTCGQVITTDAVLHTDLICAGTALWVEASNVTVRLGRHRITSTDGAGAGVVLGASPLPDHGGVCVGGVTLQGGTIIGFRGGIAEYCATDASQVAGVTLLDNDWGLYVTEGQVPLDVANSSIVGPNGIGGPGLTGALVHVSRTLVQVTSVDGVLVRDGFVQDFITFDSSRLVGGLLWVDGLGVTITDSRLVGVDSFCSNSGIGLLDSTIIGGGGYGGTSCGVDASGDRFIGPGSGTALELGDWIGTGVTDSVFTGWGTAVVESNAPFGGTMTVSGNTFRHNVTGFASCSGTYACNLAGGTVTGNRFVDNSGPGLVLNAGTWSVGSNTALRNGGLGIDAEPFGSDALFVTDLGGNIARDNEPPQCIGVVCTRHA